MKRLLGPDRPHRSGAGGVRPEEVSYEKLLKAFWENHNPTQGMRQGNDVVRNIARRSYTFGDAQKKPPTARRRCTRRRSRPKGLGAITTEIAAAGPSISPRTIISNISPRTRRLCGSRHRRVLPIGVAFNAA